MTALFAAGALWQLARFAFLLMLVAGRSWPVPHASPVLLLALSAPGLALPAAWTMYALFPRRYARYRPLLRLGQLLGMFSMGVLLVTGALQSPAEEPLLALGRIVFARSTIIAVLVLVLDGAFLAALFTLPRSGEGAGEDGR